MEEISNFLNEILDDSDVDNWLSVYSIKGNDPVSKARHKVYIELETSISTCNDALLELTRDLDNLE